MRLQVVILCLLLAGCATVPPGPPPVATQEYETTSRGRAPGLVLIFPAPPSPAVRLLLVRARTVDLGGNRFAITLYNRHDSDQEAAITALLRVRGQVKGYP